MSERISSDDLGFIEASLATLKSEVHRALVPQPSHLRAALNMLHKHLVKAQCAARIAREAAEAIEAAEEDALDARIGALHGAGAAQAIEKAYADGSLFANAEPELNDREPR